MIYFGQSFVKGIATNSNFLIPIALQPDCDPL